MRASALGRTSVLQPQSRLKLRCRERASFEGTKEAADWVAD